MSKNSSEVCRVVAVHKTDNGVLLDLQHLTRPSVGYRNIPILANFSGLIAVPQTGQKVVLSKDSTGYEYVDGVLTGPDDPAPDLNDGEFALQFDPDTTISAMEDGNGGYNLSIEASGDVTVKSEKNVLIQAGGDATVEATGNILLGENGEPVARQNHSHEYEDTGDTSDGTAGATTKTTTSPNESGTDTQIQ